MSFWSSEKFKRKQKELYIVKDFNDINVKHGAYELSLGSEAFVTSDPSGNKQIIKDKDQVIIPPGQFALLLVKERISIPANAIGFISIKASIKFRGLVNVSGFHVDPGFKGSIKFAVYNAGSQNVVIGHGEPVFLIWLSDLDDTTQDTYNGNHAGELGITSADVMNLQGEIASPSSLNQRLKNLEEIIPNELSHRLQVVESKLTNLFYVLSTLFIGVLIGILVNLVWDITNNKAPDVQTPQEESTLLNPGVKLSLNIPLTTGEPKDQVLLNAIQKPK